MAEFSKLSIYREVCMFSKEIKPSLRIMPKYIQYEIGDELLHLIRDLKYYIYLINKNDEDRIEYFNKFIDIYNHIKILIDDCLEDNYLSLKCKYTIYSPLKRLNEIGKQILKWKKYTERH